jgi:hypothetical protein
MSCWSASNSPHDTAPRARHKWSGLIAPASREKEGAAAPAIEGRRSRSPDPRAAPRGPTGLKRNASDRAACEYLQVRPLGQAISERKDPARESIRYWAASRDRTGCRAQSGDAGGRSTAQSCTQSSHNVRLSPADVSDCAAHALGRPCGLCDRVVTADVLLGCPRYLPGAHPGERKLTGAHKQGLFRQLHDRSRREALTDKPRGRSSCSLSEILPDAPSAAAGTSPSSFSIGAERGTMSTAGQAPKCRPRPASDGRRSAGPTPGS